MQTRAKWTQNKNCTLKTGKWSATEYVYATYDVSLIDVPDKRADFSNANLGHLQMDNQPDEQLRVSCLSFCVLV